MEDKNIIELYWERSEDAIKETERKYGWYGTYIASHILQNAEETAICVKESYESLWDTIPPHRPQNLKAYLCKITRNQALQMKYPAANPEIDLFSAELVIYTFLKGLEPEQRKLFVARYWYLSSVSEIAMQYKMSESKVGKTVLSLQQKLDELLEEKNILLQTEADLLFAITEIDDCYLAEAEPVQAKMEKPTQVSIKDMLSRIWNKKTIVAIVCIALLVVGVLVWPKNLGEQLPSNIDSEMLEGPVENTDLDILQFVKILNGEHLSETTFEYRKSSFPWNREWEISALPIFKNLAYVNIQGYIGQYSVFFSEDALVSMTEEIASKLNWQVLDSTTQKVTLSEDAQNIVIGIDATTDKGSIHIDGNGRVDISFTEGIQLPAEYRMSDSASIEEANKTVNYLLEQYVALFSTDKLSPNCYDVYDTDGNRSMKYQAVERTYGAGGIVEYYFNQVGFEYSEERGLTGISYGDVRVATELLGYYPIISVDEAKDMLVNGEAICLDNAFSAYEAKLSDLNSASYVELMYYVPNEEEYEHSFTDRSLYVPYYCFYVKLGDTNEYCRYYVPAVEGATLGTIPSELPVTILDMREYEVVDGMYHKDGKYYTLQNGEIVETEPPVVDPTEDPYMEYGEVIGDIQDNGAIQWNFYYKGELLANLEHLTMAISSINPTSYEARYVDGNIVIICRESRDDNGVLNDYATVLMYLTEDGTIRRLTDAIPMRSSAHPYGLNLDYDIYATMGNEENEVQILDLTTGESVDTGILYEDIEYIANASKEHFAILYKSGKIAVVEKASGQIVKTSKYQLNFNPTYIQYKDGMLYVEANIENNVIFVLKDFE